ncbi:MAG: Electron transport complex protein RnfC [Firmicutes bacterium ADurb.Bin182]|nr:MAG: Electron transport complex protein RnfC [Firmicutes bacterium ADurb.Bin182]
MGRLTFSGGFHFDRDGKAPTRNESVREFVPESVVIPMCMHLGKPCKPCVQKGDTVKIGQLIGEPDGFLGVPVHASISGEVTDIDYTQQLSAEPILSVFIKNDHKNEWYEGLKGLGDVEKVDPDLIIPAVKEAGICGMGGAAFPTHIKLTFPEGKYCDTVIVNGAECETHLTCDFRLMIESGDRIIDGLRACMRALGVKKGIIAVEDNKPEAVDNLKKLSEGREGIEVKPLVTKYPQGSEKQIIQAVTGREVPQGKLPIDAHVLVINVATAAAVADAVKEGKPLTKRIVTVTGCVNKPSNLLVPVGTTFRDLVEQCGGYSQTPGKIVAGGAMTGICAPGDEFSVTKACGGIVVFNENEAKSLEESPCIKCGRCVFVCPAGLKPYLLKTYTDAGDLNGAQAHNVCDCILCGCCSYVCPARLWLTASFKNAKEKIALAARR